MGRGRGIAAESASGRERRAGKKKAKEEHWRGNGRGEREEASEKPGAQLQTAMGIFETTDRPPPHAISFLRLALFRPPLLFAAPRRAAPRRTIGYQRASLRKMSARKTRACMHVHAHVRVGRFPVMTSLACTPPMGFKERAEHGRPLPIARKVTPGPRLTPSGDRLCNRNSNSQSKFSPDTHDTGTIIISLVYQAQINSLLSNVYLI